MGGRGMRFGISNGKWSGNVGDIVPETLKDAIGKKGKPKSISDAILESNPNFSRSYREYSENCQRCVVAYELRRRGYDVEALPTYRGDTLGRIVHIDVDNQLYMGKWRGAFKNAKTENVGATGNNAVDKVMQNISDKMKQYGSGSRAVIQVLYNRGGGHVFNVENQGGRIVYVEAQSGKIKDVKSTLQTVKTNSVNIVRTDNLKLSDRAKNFVHTKK